jgi:hypothetical protein
MGRLLSGGRVATPHLQTGRASYLSPLRALSGGALPRERFSPLAQSRRAARLDECPLMVEQRTCSGNAATSVFDDPSRTCAALNGGLQFHRLAQFRPILVCAGMLCFQQHGAIQKTREPT